MDEARGCTEGKRVRRGELTADSQQPTAGKDNGGFHHPSTSLRAGREHRVKGRRGEGRVGRHGEGRVRIWGRIWVMGLATEREVVERAVQGRRRWENARKDI